MNLKGKKALITGATGDIGQEIAMDLSRKGAIVILSGTRKEKLKAIKEKIPGTCYTFPCNLMEKDDIENLIPSITNEIGNPDILINNAGVTRDSLLLRMKDDDWKNVLTINLESVFRLSRSCIRFMMKNKWGRIINISSIVGITGNPGQGNYCASKAGIIGFSKSLAQEVATKGITVNCVAPGFIETDMTKNLSESIQEQILFQIPQKKIGRAEDIANAVSFLASSQSSYITGQTLHVNGGMSMV